MENLKYLRRQAFATALLVIVAFCMILFAGYYLVSETIGVTFATVLVGGYATVSFLFAFISALFSKTILTSSLKSVNIYTPTRQGNVSHTEKYQRQMQAIADKMGVDNIELITVGEGTINAFVAGIGEKLIVLYKGLIDLLTENEIEGVIAHEVAHAKNKDIFLTVFAYSLVTTFVGLTSLAWWVVRMLFYSGLGTKKTDGDKDKSGGGLGWIVLSLFGAGGASVYAFFETYMGMALFVLGFFFLLAYVIGPMLSSLVSQSREMLADATATAYGYGPGLQSALHKMARHSGDVKANQKGKGGLENALSFNIPRSNFLFPSHPNIYFRVSTVAALLSNKLVSPITIPMTLFACFLVGYLIMSVAYFGYSDTTQTMFLGIPLYMVGIAFWFVFSTLNIVSGIDRSSREPMPKEENPMSDKESVGMTLEMLMGLLMLFGYGFFQYWSLFHYVGEYWTAYQLVSGIDWLDSWPLLQIVVITAHFGFNMCVAITAKMIHPVIRYMISLMNYLFIGYLFFSLIS
jgi:Zn-dependent protease with chaperone function